MLCIFIINVARNLLIITTMVDFTVLFCLQDSKIDTYKKMWNYMINKKPSVFVNVADVSAHLFYDYRLQT